MPAKLDLSTLRVIYRRIKRSFPSASPDTWWGQAHTRRQQPLVCAALPLLSVNVRPVGRCRAVDGKCAPIIRECAPEPCLLSAIVSPRHALLSRPRADIIAPLHLRATDAIVRHINCDVCPYQGNHSVVIENTTTVTRLVRNDETAANNLSKCP